MVTMHAITLKALNEDTSYHYRVESITEDGEQVSSNDEALKTAVRSDGPFSFTVTSEMANTDDSSLHKNVYEAMLRYHPEFLLLVGDAVADGRIEEEWDKTLFGPGKNVLGNTPFYLCLGNHEECAPQFYELVSYPEPKRYYSFDYGNTHFVALDSTSPLDYKGGRKTPDDAGGEFRAGGEQYEFLVNDLEDCSAQWKVVFFHYPPYGSGNYQVEEMRVLCPLLEKYNVDLVFNSHTMVYERSHPLRDGKVDHCAGVTYVVAGGARACPEWFHHKRSWHAAQAVAVPHFIQVVIAGPVLALNAIDLDGHLFDTITVEK